MKWLRRKIKGAFLRIIRLPKKVLIPGIIVVVGILSFGGYKAADAYDYMQNNPQFCRSCHIMEQAWDRWSTSEHKNINCHECHELGIFQGAGLLLKTTLGLSPDVPKHALVDNDTCAKCHESGNPKWLQVAATAGHRVHAEEQNVACTKCHSVTLHRFAPPKPICSVCHEEKKVEVVEMGEMHCLACHNFLKENGPLVPTREPCLSCH